MSGCSFSSKAEKRGRTLPQGAGFSLFFFLFGTNLAVLSRAGAKQRAEIYGTGKEGRNWRGNCKESLVAGQGKRVGIGGGIAKSRKLRDRRKADRIFRSAFPGLAILDGVPIGAPCKMKFKIDANGRFSRKKRCFCPFWGKISPYQRGFCCQWQYAVNGRLRRRA